jgi:hypothetical protein
MDALNAGGTAAECTSAECAVFSEQPCLRGCILGKASWAENGHRAAAEPGMWLGHRVPCRPRLDRANLRRVAFNRSDDIPAGLNRHSTGS